MGFRMANFLGDPFAISTVSFGVIAWIVAIAGAGSSALDNFPRFTWWGLVYEILLIIMVFLLYLNNTIELYKFTLVGLLLVGFLYTTNSTNNLIYSSNLGNLCCAAGCILLSMLNFLWIVYFGGHPESPSNQFIDSFAMKSSYAQQLPSEKNDDHEFAVPRSASGLQGFGVSDSRHSQLTNSKSGYMSLSQLNGLENFSHTNVQNTGTVGASNPASMPNTVYNTNGTNTADSNFAVPVLTFRYKARALYSYDASPDDINEISFVKDEVLEVDDIDGKWWQARRANGQVGICPSNYVKLLD